MIRVSVSAIASAVLLGWLAPAQTADPTPEEKALARVKELGGVVQRDEKQFGEPVVGVHLDNRPVTDADLKELAAFKSLTGNRHRILDHIGAEFWTT